MRWVYLLQSGVVPMQNFEHISINIGQEQELLVNYDDCGFITDDTHWGRAIIARIAAFKKLPIIYNSIPKYQSCVLISNKLPVINKSDSVCFIGGRGLGSAKEYGVLADMAEQCYASVGATRAIVDAGWAPIDHQIGQGGLMPHVDYAVLVGVSGAIQHTIGLKFVKCVIAINPDVNAPIFELAQYGIITSWQRAKSVLVNSLFGN